MDIWLIFAYVYDGIVQNIASYLYTGYTEASLNAIAIYGTGAIAVNVTHIPVHIGDSYLDGDFYRDGIKVEPIPSISQQTAINSGNIIELNNTIDDIIIAVTPMGDN